MRYKNWKMYYTMSQPGPAGWIMPLIPFHFTLVQNIKRDPFEQAVGIDQKTAMSLGGALAGPVTAFQYDWNMLPIGQQLWLGASAESYEKYPAAAGSGELQPQSDPGRRSRRQMPVTRATSRMRTDAMRGRGCPNRAPADC